MTTSDYPEHIAQALLSQAHPDGRASTIYQEKILHKPLHLRPTSPPPNTQDARAQRRLQRLRKQERAQRRVKPKPLSAKQKRVQGVYDIPESARRYDIYVPLHKMWIEYMWEVLGLKAEQECYVTAQAAGPKLASADFNGAMLEVVKSRCLGRVGCKGVVLRDTKFTFEVITDKDRVITIPKAHTVFRFQISQPGMPSQEGDSATNSVENGTLGESKPDLIFELYGSQFENRATDRATRKFKQRRLEDL